MELTRNSSANYILEIKKIISQARKQAYSSVNRAMVLAYWEIGEGIVLEEQKGDDRAAYGKQVVENLAIELSKEFGKGFSSRSLWEYRQFYLAFSDEENLRTMFADLGISKITDRKSIMRTVFAECNRNIWQSPSAELKFDKGGLHE